MSSVFTVEDGIEIQKSQLKRWKSVLTAEAYSLLESIVIRDNHLAENGYDICRGTSIDEIITNQIQSK